MEPYFDESQDSLTVEEDREYRVRYEKRQRMRRERQRRMHKKRMIKRYLFLGVFVIGMVLIGAAIKSGRKPGREENLPKEQDTAAVKPPDGLKTEEITESLPEENPAEAEGTEETEDAGSQAEGVKYRFEEMSDTAVIDSEDVISTQAILVDESTDTIVAARGARDRIIPASMTKVLTILVAAEHIYAAGDVMKMIANLKEIMADETVLDRHLQVQREAAGCETAESYRRLVNDK